MKYKEFLERWGGIESQDEDPLDDPPEIDEEDQYVDLVDLLEGPNQTSVKQI